MNIFLDIETLPTNNAVVLERIRNSITAPGQYKKPESIAAWLTENLETETAAQAAKTSLDGTWGRVACIGWAIDDGPVMAIQNDDERVVLTEWASDLKAQIKSRYGHDSSWQYCLNWIGHNVQDFDLRFLWQRTRVLNVDLGFRLPLERYSKNVYDTMKEWSGFGKYVKQTDLELAFGIARADEITGADVATSTSLQIWKHCREDVRCLREIYQRMVS